MSTFDVENRSAIVTGAGSGIGRAVAQVLAANGAAVLVVDFDQTRAETVARDIVAAGGVAQAFVGNIADPELATKMVAEASALAPLRIAVNNAGIGDEFLPIAETSDQSWHKVVGVNLDGLFYGLRQQIPAIAAAGGGSIVNISSVFGSVGAPNNASYVSTKHAVVGLTKAAALEGGSIGVRVNAVGPGAVNTAVTEHMDDATREALAGQHPLGRLGEPDEIANLVAFLASDASTFITGAFYLADGGYSIQ